MLSGDPVGLGLAQSLARPGGNATGISNLSVEIIGKRLEFLKEMVPNLARVAVLREANLAIHSRFVQKVESAGRTLKIDTQIVAARGPEDIEATMAAAVSAKAQALIVFEGPLANTNIAQIVALAAKSRLPDMYSFRESADAGGLMAYGSNLVATYEHFAIFVDKILRGARPGDLPIKQAIRFELVINARTAKVLGLTVPPTLLSLADVVIS
jgi:putative ABC transport system substrate-binding protein